MNSIQNDVQVGQVEGLLSCPFCGAQPEYDFFIASHYPHEVYCDKCIGVVATQQGKLEEAIAAWNRRTPPPAPLSAQSVNRHAYDRVPTVDEYTRNILESMVDDWLRRYEPGVVEWSDAQVIRSWLDNYKGTFYAELAQSSTVTASVPLWSDAELQARYRAAFEKDIDVHLWAFLCWVRDDYEAHRAARGGVPRPDWSQAPEWAMWWAVHAAGGSSLFRSEPVISVNFWVEGDDRKGRLGYDWHYVDIPLGVDWRTLKQQRTTTTREGAGNDGSLR